LRSAALREGFSRKRSLTGGVKTTEEAERAGLNGGWGEEVEVVEGRARGVVLVLLCCVVLVLVLCLGLDGGVGVDGC